ncbi:MAG: ABC transporter permease [Planctomycetes bacterium]|nr:ABC transporter permease [Planctomycetota bacterium]
MSKAITEKTEDKPPQGWQPGAEIAPSLVREDEPRVARTIGLVGASFVIFGAVALFINAVRQDARVGIGWASLCLALGVVGLLAHAAFDRDLQVRRLYWGAGLALLGLGSILCILPVKSGVGALFPLGYPCFYVALFFLLAVLHHEPDFTIRQTTIKVIGAAGALGAALGFVLGNNFAGKEFLVPYGALLILAALIYLAAFVSLRGIGDDLGYRAGLGIGALGLAAIALGLIRTLFMPAFLVPGGVLYIGLGILYLLVAVGLCSDHPFVVLTRRDLAAYFLSPLMYLVLVGMTAVAWFSYRFQLLDAVLETYIPEPITSVYLWGLFPVLTVTFFIPVLTMRLLSEEKRTGSLEVLLTAPVKESTVVLGKFFAAFLLYLFLWSPWWLFLVALRVGGGQEFDYRTLFSFVVAMSVTGAGFVALGLFFSSLTRNQVASAVLTFAVMMLLLGVYLLRLRLGETSPNSPWLTVLIHTDYVEMWRQATRGILIPRQLLFHGSMAVVWLFLTVKVLEARRWA